MIDEQLLTDFVAHGDGSAFEGLVRRHGPMVFRVCRDVLGDRDQAEDAFQATFLVLLRKAGSIRESRTLGRWLYEVASRVSQRERRRLSRLRSQERQAPEMEAAAPPDFDPADREMKPILHEEIGRLPSKLREALVLHYFQGLTVDEVARRLDCPVGTLKSRLAKGRELLRARLTRRGLAASVLLLLLFSLTEESQAALPDSLVEATLRAGTDPAGSVGVSRRVASMVLLEENGGRWARLASSLGLLVVLILVLGASRMAEGRKSEATEPLPLSTPASGLVVPSTAFQATSAVPPGVPPGGHCLPDGP